MGIELGRISGSLLASNLLRKGSGSGEENLAFEDNLLYLDVINSRVGINKLPSLGKDLDVNSVIRSTDLKVPTEFFTPNFVFGTNTIQNLVNKIYIQPEQTDPQILTPKVGTLNLNISDKLIENITSNSDINLNPYAGSQVHFTTSELYIDGSLTVNGQVQWDGSLVTLGSDSNDNVVFQADINSHIIPNVDNAYDLGSALQEWKTTYVYNSFINNTTVGSAGLSVSTFTSNTLANLNGDVVIGNLNTDIVTFASQIDSDLIPTNSTYSLGTLTGPKRWDTLFVSNLNVDGVVEIDSNTITTLTTDTDLKFVADGTGIIHVTLSDVEITNDLTVGQLTTINNDVSVTGLLSLLGDNTYTLTGNANRTGNTDITGSLTQYGNFTTQFQDVQIFSNVIKTTLSNNNLELQADGAGIVNFVSSVQIDNNLDVTGNGHLASVTTTAGVEVSDFYVGDFHIADNYIETVNTNEDLLLEANGAGTVYIPLNDVSLAGNLTVVENLTVNGLTTTNDVEIVGTTTQTGNIDQTGNLYTTGDLQSSSIVIVPPSWVESEEIKIQGTTISVKTLNTDLIFQANGDGGIVFDRQLRIKSNVISNIFDVNDISLSFNNVYITEDGQLLWLEDESDILLTDQKNDRDLSVIFEPNGLGNMIIDSDKALAIAYGNNSTAILEISGEIRQNTDGIYEGFSNTGNVSFTNLYDADHNTYITPELTPGYNDNTLRFGVNGIVKGQVDSVRLYENTLYADNVKISSNAINNLNASVNLEFNPRGTGNFIVNGIYFKDDDITNQLDSAIIIQSTGTGYVKFAGTSAVVIPYGDESTKPVTAELGQTRYNTQLGYLEIWDGTGWVSATGASNQATEDQVIEVMDIWSLILG